jgi:hypothetical protein
MASERAGRFALLSGFAWLAMLTVIGVWAIVSWYFPGGRDSDMSSSLEKGMIFVYIMALPMAALAGAVLAPSAYALDRWLGGRFRRPTNMALGVALTIPASIAFLAGNWLLFGGGGRSFAGYLRNVARSPASMLVLASAFAIGGAILGTGIRRRGDVAHEP